MEYVSGEIISIVGEVSLSPDQFDQLIAFTPEQVDMLFAYLQGILDYQHNMYTGFVIVWSIVFSILILCMFYKLLVDFGR